MIDIEKLKELEKAATKGPWMVSEDEKRPGEFIIISNPKHWVFEYPEDFPEKSTPDSLFIAEMRNMLPELLAYIQRLEGAFLEAKAYELWNSSDIFNSYSTCQRKADESLDAIRKE